MKGMHARRWQGSTTLAIVIAAGLATGCRDSGLPDRNLPKAEAERRTYSYPAYQAAATAPVVWELGGRKWQAGGLLETIDAALLRPVASASGTAVYALAWDQEPYDRLYTPAGQNRWQPVHVID